MPKIKLFLHKKLQNLRALGAKPPDPLTSGYGGVAPKLSMAEPTLV